MIAASRLTPAQRSDWMGVQAGGEQKRRTSSRACALMTSLAVSSSATCVKQAPLASEATSGLHAHGSVQPQCALPPSEEL
jgi:hypothetical protein